ncbi:hypothetical protein [Pseudomonas sp.]|uniref:hypothetical protein n=1 Tax=Pseudomonas sp. TaxID=306 RepID=UPI002627347C|nr:hypothetical protein [Pseudomonas sp.]
MTIQKARDVDAGAGLRKSTSFFSATPEERYEFRILIAEYLTQRRLINEGERRELVEEAAAAYADELG